MKTTNPSISDLLARVEGLTGPDREVDALIFDHFSPPRTDGPHPPEGFGGPPSDFGRWDPEFTASLDAVLALVERVRPGWYPEVCKNYQGDPPRVPAWSSDLCAPDRQETFEASAATPALALLCALLKSLNNDD